ncbi:hypothetical protein [Stappia phage SI01]|uniref:Tail tubular protein A n=1 Tax=Stappia phage SI01 TaxID=2847766 RepID=A0AAE7VIU7_9CAUD|nr:hypothetical protein [Stappia phage SI01]
MPSRAQIINHMLRAIGESGVSNDQSLHPSVQTCNHVLDSANEEMQQRGWWFNRETSLTLVPDNRGEVIVPPNALSVHLSAVESMKPTEKTRYVIRGGLVYDNVEHTSALYKNVVIDCVLLLPIDDLPSTAQTYIQHLAAETVFLDEDGDVQKHQKLQHRTQLAWQALQAEQLRNLATNAHDRTQVRLLQSGWRNATHGRNPNYIGGRLR